MASLRAGEALRAARRRRSRSTRSGRRSEEREGEEKNEVRVKGGAADRVFYTAGERPGPSDLIRWLARVAAARAGGRPAGVANSRPRPRFLGLGSG